MRNGQAAECFVAAAVKKADALIFYRQVTSLPALVALRRFVSAAAAGAPTAAGFYARFLGELAGCRTWSGWPGHAWQHFLTEAVLGDENPYTLAGERREDTTGYEALLRRDLHIIDALYNMDFPTLEKTLIADSDAGQLLPLVPLSPTTSDPLAGSLLRQQMATALATGTPWPDLINILTAYHRQYGAGVCARFAAFRWLPQRAPGSGASVPPLAGVMAPDPVRWEQLAEYEAERAAVAANTERFLAGLPASNVLLYGERGTGKSATVKALLWRYAEQGLRMVEVERRQLAAIPEILAYLTGRGGKFILFADDLSFDEGDSSYKDLKAVLEGSLAARPANVLVYATTNRRHLVTEKFGDRSAGAAGDDSEVRRFDTLQEKLSVSDRFGLTIIFPSPDQEAYLRIVAHLAAQAGIAIAPAELRDKALRWALWRNGQTPRSARQFIDDLLASLAERPLGTAGAQT